MHYKLTEKGMANASKYWKCISLRNVRFLHTDEGFFASMSERPGLGREPLAERVIKSRINIFAERPYRYWGYAGRYGYNRRHRNSDNGVNMRMYFNKGYDELHKVSYRNLSLAMADDTESIDLLKGYRRSMNASTALYIGAGLTVGSSLVSFLAAARHNQADFGMQNGFARERSMPNFTTSFIMLGAGTGLAIGGYVLHFSGVKKLEAAVDHYNR